VSDAVGKSILVKGKVQGVFYRASTVEQAVKIGVGGYVKNLPSGEVYIEVFGTKRQINKLISWCKEGSEWARVNDLIVGDLPYRPDQKFEIRY
jgi:acylphosphatase